MQTPTTSIAEQMQNVVRTTIDALSRDGLTDPDVDFSAHSNKRLAAISQLGDIFAQEPMLFWYWLPVIGMEIITDQICLNDYDAVQAAKTAARNVTSSVHTIPAIPDGLTVTVSAFGGGFTARKLEISALFEHIGVTAMQQSVHDFLALCKTLRLAAVFHKDDCVELCFLVADSSNPTLYDFLMEVVGALCNDDNTTMDDTQCAYTLAANLRAATVLSAADADGPRRSRMALHYAAGQYKTLSYTVLRTMSRLTELPPEVARAIVSKLNSMPNIARLLNLDTGFGSDQNHAAVKLLNILPVHFLPVLAQVPETERYAADFSIMMMHGLRNMVLADIQHCAQMRELDETV